MPESVAYEIYFLDVIFLETRTARGFFKHRLGEPKNTACTPSMANGFGNFSQNILDVPMPESAAYMTGLKEYVCTTKSVLAIEVCKIGDAAHLSVESSDVKATHTLQLRMHKLPQRKVPIVLSTRQRFWW